MSSALRLTGLITLSLLVVACSSSPYRPADGGRYGYSETALSDDQYRVHFRARGDDTHQAMDYVLLRASELALEKGFDWLEVTHRETHIDRRQLDAQSPAALGMGVLSYQECGLLTCRTFHRPSQRYHQSMVLGDQRSEVEVVVEIRMGIGMRPGAGENFDARDLYERLAPES